MTETPMLFDRPALRQRRLRQARVMQDAARDADFLRREVAERLADRLADIRRDFAVAAELGAQRGHFTEALTRRGVAHVLALDIAAEAGIGAGAENGVMPVTADEGFLPLAEGSMDLIASNLALHWVNDLPGTLLQIRNALKPDGFFLASLFGGATLTELRGCLAEAETRVLGGVSPRIAPFGDLRDYAGLLQRAGFALPVADTDTITVRYQEPLRLLQDLRAMGESSILTQRQKRPMPRAVLFEAMRIYRDRFTDGTGRVPATFEIVYLAGWRPAPTQPQPLRPGSATGRLAEALGTQEQETPDPAGPPKRH